MSQMLIRINKKMDDALKELAKEHERNSVKNYVEDTPEGIILNGIIEQWEPAENREVAEYDPWQDFRENQQIILRGCSDAKGNTSDQLLK